MEKAKLENRGYKGWGIKKLDNRPVRVLMKDCADPKLYAKCYNMFIAGYAEEEVAKHMNVDIVVVERAIEHTRSCLSSRTIISHNNDRHRILLQRTESEKYRKLLGDALNTPVQDYLAAGIAPAGTLREFRQAVGMEEKPGAMNINVTQNSAINIRSEIRSSEDLLRSVIKRMAEKNAMDVNAPLQGPPEELPAEHSDEDTEE
jgi:hypothetical protein